MRKNSQWLSKNKRLKRIALHAGKQWARFAEVGALAPVFEKSATESKP